MIREIGNRCLRFLAVFLVGGVAVVIGWTLLALGYSLSDTLYATGIWPLGALMRIFLLFSFGGLALSTLGWVVFTLAQVFGVRE